MNISRSSTIGYFLCLYLFFVAAVLPAACAQKSDSDKIRSEFYQANLYYAAGKYSKAIEVYEDIIRQGWESGNLYYNLGNSYFKNGQLGRAILNYEKAMRLIPLDRDLESNYRYACSLIKIKVSETKKFGIMRFIDKIFAYFTINWLAVFLSVIYIGILLILLASLYIYRLRKWRSLATVVLLVVFGLAFVALYRKASTVGRQAVVIAKKAEARFEPFEKATVYFTFYEGMKADVLLRRGRWCKVRRSDGKVAWIKKDSVDFF
jgi:tetratricopeptide (TPR) repeat protein